MAAGVRTGFRSVCGVRAVRVVVRGAALLLSLWCSPLRCLGAVFVLAVCLPCPLPCARPLLGCWLPPVSFVASLLFTPSSTLLPGTHFFPALSQRLRFGACLGLLPCRLVVLSHWAFSSGPAKRKDAHGRAVAGVLSRHGTLLLPSCGGVICHLLMLRSCAPLSYFLPCCACYGVFYRASFDVGPYPTCSRHGSTHLFGHHLCSLSVPRGRRDMQHTCEGDKL